MVRERSLQIDQQQQRQRRALIFFTMVLAVFVCFCIIIGIGMLTPPPSLIPVGKLTDYRDDQPRRYPVPKLNISALIPQRATESINSEDVIFVRHLNDDSWIGLLGTDTLSGCFLYWDASDQLFKDNNCLGSRYTSEGRYLDGLTTGEQPQNMARLPVEVHDGQVFVRDELVRLK